VKTVIELNDEASVIILLNDKAPQVFQILHLWTCVKHKAVTL